MTFGPALLVQGQAPLSLTAKGTADSSNSETNDAAMMQHYQYHGNPFENNKNSSFSLLSFLSQDSGMSLWDKLSVRHHIILRVSPPQTLLHDCGYYIIVVTIVSLINKLR